MYLSNIKLWNFRKFGSEGNFNLNKPDLDLNFTKGLNVLIGENDSGKSAIIDAIKLVLKTHAYEWIRIVDEDFYNEADRFRIELRFDFSKNDDDVAKHFTQWLGWVGEKVNAVPILRIIFDVKRTAERIIPSDVKGGMDNEGSPLTAEAREFLKVTYLKPLRDATAELIPKRNSRLSQIFQEHEAFKGKKEDHYLVGEFGRFNRSIGNYFKGLDHEDNVCDDQNGEELKKEIDEYIHSFYDAERDSEIKVSEGTLKKILETLELSLLGEISPGLGTLNRLFMASELIHLGKENWSGLRLGLIEELEAHLHPQAQMRIIETLQANDDYQLILTTHSPNLASKVKLDNLIICHNNTAFPMGKDYTQLEEGDYKYLEKFLDVTKSNLFFAKGVIMVEGWSEELILPALARKLKQTGVIKKDLTEAGVSIVNVANTGFLHFSRIFLRENQPLMDIPVAILTDVDIREYKKSGDDIEKRADHDEFLKETNTASKELKEKFENQGIKVFVAPEWTLEYSIYKSSILSNMFQSIVLSVHCGTTFTDFEKELARKLLNRGLKKTEIAYQLANQLEENEEIKLIKPVEEVAGKLGMEESAEETSIDTINYLIEAIKYVCRD